MLVFVIKFRVVVQGRIVIFIASYWGIIWGFDVNENLGEWWNVVTISVLSELKILF